MNQKLTEPTKREIEMTHEPLEWGTNCLSSPDRGPHECNGRCVGFHICLRCGCRCLCGWCNEGNPRCQSSVSEKLVHTDTPIGRVVCIDPPIYIPEPNPVPPTDEKRTQTVAAYVGITEDQIRRFVGAMNMVGLEIVETAKLAAPPAPSVSAATAILNDEEVLARRDRNAFDGGYNAGYEACLQEQRLAAISAPIAEVNDACEGEPCWRNPETGYVEYCNKHEGIVADMAMEADVVRNASRAAVPEPLASPSVPINEEMREALKKLRSEVIGWLELEPARLSGIMGFTNVAVMREKVDIADAVLAKSDQAPQEVTEDVPCEWFGRSMGKHDLVDTADGHKRCAKCKHEFLTPKAGCK